jgi:HD-like signal output (HDOD) protein
MRHSGLVAFLPITDVVSTRVKPVDPEALKQQLLDEVTQLPVGQDAALRLLIMFDDPEVSTAAVGLVVEADPALTVQVLRIANSPYYGLSRRVSSVRQAITVLGFAMVRSLAAAKIFKLAPRDSANLPASFWQHSFTTAAAASVLARHSGAPPNDAFSAGLLVDVGSALLRRNDPKHYGEVLRLTTHGTLLIDAEREIFGVAHPEVSGFALERLRFPADVATAVSEHHLMPARSSTPLGRTLFLADLLAHEVEGTPYEASASLTQGLEWLGIDPADAVSLVEQTRAGLAKVEPLQSLMATA